MEGRSFFTLVVLLTITERPILGGGAGFCPLPNNISLDKRAVQQETATSVPVCTSRLTRGAVPPMLLDEEGLVPKTANEQTLVSREDLDLRH